MELGIQKTYFEKFDYVHWELWVVVSIEVEIEDNLKNKYFYSLVNK